MTEFARETQSFNDVPPVSSFLSYEERLAKVPWLIEAELCRQVFAEFVKVFWEVVCPEPLKMNWHIELLCNELQAIAQNVFLRKPKDYDLIINIPPGTTKSTVCTILFPAWTWTNDPTLRSLSASYSANLSLEHSDKSRDVIKSDKYRLYYGDTIRLKIDKDLKSNYENTRLGSRFSTSVGGTATGMHGHFIIVDDPLNPKQAVSDLERKAANDWLDNTLSTRKVDKAMTPLILIMQRLHINDCTAHILAKGTKVKHICLPGTLHGSGEVKPPIEEIRETYKGAYTEGYLDPTRLSKEVLEEMRKDMGEYNYLSQIDQSPKLRENAMFKIENFNIVNGYKQEDVVSSVRYWDKAGTKGDGKFTAGVLIHKMKNGRFLIADVVRGQWAAPEREARIRMMAAIDGKKVYIVTEQEPGSGGKESAENTIRSLAGYRVYADRVTGAKEVRAEPYSIQVENYNVDVLNRNWTRDFVNEHEVYPFGRFVDQIDAAGGAFNFLTGKTRQAGAWGRQ